MLTKELEHFALDISNAIHANPADLVVLNVAIEEFAAMSEHLNALIESKDVKIFNKDFASLTPLIELSKSDTQDVASVLIINARNDQDHTNLEMLAFDGKACANIDSQEVLITHDVTVFNGDNYFGEEIL